LPAEVTIDAFITRRVDDHTLEIEVEKGRHINTVFEQLDALGIANEARVISAHRTPQRHHDFVTAQAPAEGVKVFICGAGMAAHLAGVTAALSSSPVIGVPLESGGLGGMDSLLSTVQMPGGMPVATVAVGKAGAKNAAILAAQMLGLAHPEIAQAVTDLRAKQTAGVPEFPG